MAFVFEVQDPDNPTSTSNAYISVQYFKDYCDGRGYDYSALNDTEIEQAIVRATDFMDARWTYEGHRYDDDQSTEVPRGNVWDEHGLYLDGFPDPFEDACCEYTKIDAIDGLDLMPNNVTNTAPGQLTYERKRVEGAVEREFHYHPNKGYGSSSYPSWPIPDRMMKHTGLLGSTRRTLGRG